MIKHFKIKKYFKKLNKVDNSINLTERYIDYCIAFNIKPSVRTILQLNKQKPYHG